MKLQRRAVLRGFGGLAIGLPLLEAFGSGTARAQSASPAKRFILCFEHGGYIERGFDDLGWLPDPPDDASPPVEL